MCSYLVFSLAQFFFQLLHPQTELLDLGVVALHPSVGMGQFRSALLELLLELCMNMTKIGQLLQTQHTAMRS